mgnify:CR=1 FL=1
MRAIQFNSNVETINPVSGFALDFSASESSKLTFLSGKSRFFVNRPEFAITGVEFSGINAAVEFGDTSVRDQVDFTLLMSGKVPNEFDLDNASGILNIEKLNVYTGSFLEEESDTNILSPDFEKFSFQADVENSNINFSLDSEELGGETGTLFYKFKPFDRLNSGISLTGVGLSGIASGQMLTSEFLADVPSTFTDEELYIARTGIDGSITLNDLKLNNRTLSISGNCQAISFNKNIADDFTIILDLRTDKDVLLTGGSGFGRLADADYPTFINRKDPTTFDGTGNIFLTGGKFTQHVVVNDTTAGAFMVQEISA